ncbi:MAG: hypothetical protein INR68_15620 [Methylobacterium mesophilicum]|nr:hypothetical protein [Methylobacterium mesophilicum]
MSGFLKTLALAATLGIGATAIPAAAHADSVYFAIGQGGPEFGVVADDGGPRGYPQYDSVRDERRWDRDDGDERDWRRDRWERDRWERRGSPRCSPDRALDKAERMGIRRPDIRRVTDRTIRVVGWQRGNRVSVTFARAPSCPVIDW